jgi:magnesium transporter
MGRETHPPPPAKLYSLRRAWLMMNAAGETAILEATKMEMQRELGVPFRDLMILDPALPTAYPGSIFIRPRAIVVNMEHVKLVVTSGLVVSPLPPLDKQRSGENSAAFARAFTRRLKRQLAHFGARETDDFQFHSEEACEEDMSLPDEGDFFDETSPAFLKKNAKDATRTKANDPAHPKEESESVSKPSVEPTTGLLGLRQTPCELRVLLLPFELRVVEAALHDVCMRLLDETVALERDAAPALETLADRVSAASLEKTRGIKAAMNKLAARVGAVREALEKLLQDDDDMAAMCLSSADGKDRSEGDDAEKTTEDDDVPASVERRDAERRDVDSGTSTSQERREDKDDSLDSLKRMRSSASSASRSGASVASGAEGPEAHEGVEALLEAYYMHCDYSFKRLNELRGSVEDTEDLAEIKLDSQRNQLIKVDLMLSNGALAVGAFSMVVGVFGMNLPTGLETSREAFSEVLFVSAVACLALFVTVVVLCRRWKLLQM